mgnify:CR=1 FL=1
MEKLKNDIENAKNIDIVKIHNDVVIEKSKRSRNIGDKKNNFQKRKVFFCYLDYEKRFGLKSPILGLKCRGSTVFYPVGSLKPVT